MARIIKVRDVERGFTVVTNNIFREKEMSLKAKGLYCLMWSLPDNWNFSVDGLAVLSLDGRDGVKSGLDELVEYRYLIRGGQTRENGRLSSADYELHQVPYGPPLKEFPSTAKTAQLNTKGSSTINNTCRERGVTESNEDTRVTLGTRARKKPEKHRYGSFKNILLSDEEFDKLSKNPDIRDVGDWIEKASGYIEAKGDKYKSHYAMILNWVRMDKERNKPVKAAERERRYDHDDRC